MTHLYALSRLICIFVFCIIVAHVGLKPAYAQTPRGVTYDPQTGLIAIEKTFRQSIYSVRLLGDSEPLIQFEGSSNFAICTNGDTQVPGSVVYASVPPWKRTGQFVQVEIQGDQLNDEMSQGCSGRNGTDGPINVSQVSLWIPSQTFGHIQHLSYYYGVFNGSPYTNEFRGHSNTAFVVPQGGTGSELIVLMDSLVGAPAMKAIVAIDKAAFLESNPDTGCTLFPDWQTRLNGLLQAASPYVASGRIVAFYPMDEPHPSCVPKVQEVIAFTKGIFPSVPHGIIFKGNADGAWPNNLDWVGFDNYANCGDPTAIGTNRFAFSRMKQRLSPTQRIMVVADAYIPCYFEPTQADLYAAFLADVYLAMAADPSVIAVVPFIWFAGGGATLGIRDLPKTRARYVDFGVNRTNLSR